MANNLPPSALSNQHAAEVERDLEEMLEKFIAERQYLNEAALRNELHHMLYRAAVRRSPQTTP